MSISLRKDMSNNMKFSLLLSVYVKENPRYLNEALGSIENQTLQPFEIILVKDGLLTPELDSIIVYNSEHSKIPYKIIELKENVGLGEALNEGMRRCTCMWIARMDSDDIALPVRFEKQFLYLSEHSEIDILGGWICEFDEIPKKCNKERRVPELHDDIVKFSKHRNPLNHMTVVFRKSVEQVVRR